MIPQNYLLVVSVKNPKPLLAQDNLRGNYGEVKQTWAEVGRNLGRTWVGEIVEMTNNQLDRFNFTYLWFLLYAISFFLAS